MGRPEVRLGDEVGKRHTALLEVPDEPPTPLLHAITDVGRGDVRAVDGDEPVETCFIIYFIITFFVLSQSRRCEGEAGLR